MFAFEFFTAWIRRVQTKARIHMANAMRETPSPTRQTESEVPVYVSHRLIYEQRCRNWQFAGASFKPVTL